MKRLLLFCLLAAACNNAASGKLTEVPPAPNPQSLQVVSGAASMHAGKYQLDAQVGTVLPTAAAIGGSRTLQAETPRR